MADSNESAIADWPHTTYLELYTENIRRQNVHPTNSKYDFTYLNKLSNEAAMSSTSSIILLATPAIIAVNKPYLYIIWMVSICWKHSRMNSRKRKKYKPHSLCHSQLWQSPSQTTRCLCPRSTCQICHPRNQASSCIRKVLLIDKKASKHLY